MKKMNVFAIILMTSFLVGCGTTAKFVYPAKMDTMVKIQTSPVSDKKVAVIPFDDYRNSENTSGSVGFAYLPLMPFGWVEYNRPDAARMFITIQQYEFTPAEDFPKAAALSLRKSGLFKDAYFSFGNDDKADYVLCGEIKSTKYVGNMWTYGLSFFGSYLWILGLPVGNSECELAIVLTLKKQNKVVWEYTFNRSNKIWQGYYYHLGQDAVAYSELMQAAMNEAIVDMAKHFREHPELLK